MTGTPGASKLSTHWQERTNKIENKKNERNACHDDGTSTGKGKFAGAFRGRRIIEEFSNSGEQGREPGQKRSPNFGKSGNQSKTSYLKSNIKRSRNAMPIKSQLVNSPVGIFKSCTQMSLIIVNISISYFVFMRILFDSKFHHQDKHYNQLKYLLRRHYIHNAQQILYFDFQEKPTNKYLLYSKKDHLQHITIQYHDRTDIHIR